MNKKILDCDFCCEGRNPGNYTESVRERASLGRHSGKATLRSEESVQKPASPRPGQSGAGRGKSKCQDSKAQMNWSYLRSRARPYHTTPGGP